MTSAGATPAWEANPYPGLRPFEPGEEHLFFGRERHIDRMVDTLAARRLLAVLGGSGSGKSSLVTCGLQPALRRGALATAGTHWRIARFRPGLAPIQSLATALAAALSPARTAAASNRLADHAVAELSQADVIATKLRLSRLGLVEVLEQACKPPYPNLLVVADQFEELFRYRSLSQASPRAAGVPGDSPPLKPQPSSGVAGSSTTASNTTGTTTTAAEEKAAAGRAAAESAGAESAATSADLGTHPAALTEAWAAADEGLALVNLLLAASAQRRLPIYIVLTMRSDFLGDCDQFPGLAEAVTAGAYLVPRLSRDERRRAIAMPALVSGARIDPVLLTQLVNDVGADPDQLSILQHALRRTWEHWHDRGSQGPLSLDDYEAIGTMATALDSHAEQTLASCGGEPDGALCASLFRALTDKVSDPRGIRRPTPLAELQAICGASPERLNRLVDHFRQSDRAFLMPPAAEALRPDSVIDISHESLMRVWRRLDHWADAEAGSARLFRRLSDASRRHRSGETSLWRDPELQIALNWRDQQQPTPAWASRYDPDLQPALVFLDESDSAREAERRRQRRRRRRTVIGLASLSLSACLVATFCWIQWQQTRLSRARAYAAMAAALLPARPYESLLYGLAAMERLIDEPAEALSLADSLSRALNLNWEIGQLSAPGPAITALLQLRDGDWITASAAGQLRRWRDRRPLGPPIATGQGEINALLQLADGDLVTGGADGRLRRWRQGRPIGPALVHGGGAVLSLVQLSDGELVSGDDRGTLRRWRRFRPVGAPIATGQGRLTALLALPGAELLSGGSGGRAETASRVLRRWRQGRPLGAPIATRHDGVLQLVAQGQTVLSLGGEGRVQSWRPGQAAATPWQPKVARAVRQLLPLPNGALVSGHDDGSLRLWSARGEPRLGYAASADLRHLLALRDGQLLAAAASGRLHLLDPAAAIGQPRHTGQGAVLSLLAQGPGDLVSGGEDGSLRRWRQRQPLGGPILSGQGSLSALLGLANGDLISAGFPPLNQAEPASSLRGWRGSSPLGAPVATRMAAIRQLLPTDQGEWLGFGEDLRGRTAYGRWRLERAAPRSLMEPIPLPVPSLSSVVRLADGVLISASRVDGRLHRWTWSGSGPPRRREVIATSLDGIGSLALLPGDRFLVVGEATNRGGGQEVRLLDLRSGAWVARAISVEGGAASALAVLPDQGIVIGSTNGQLRWLEPRRILAAACRELGPFRSEPRAAAANGLGDDVAKQACGACGC